jgi:hypothetical protein
MRHDTSKKKYCKDMPKDASNLFPVQVNTCLSSPYVHSIGNFISPPENSTRIYVNSPVEEADEWSSLGKSESLHKDSGLSSPKTSVKHDATDPSDTETSQSDALGALDDNGDADQENTPVCGLGVGEPGPKEDESGGE